MTNSAAGISEADRLAIHASVRFLIQAQQAEIQQLREAKKKLEQRKHSGEYQASIAAPSLDSCR